MERIEDCISFLVGKAAQRISRRARELLAPLHLTPTQYAVLKVLWEQDGQSGAELGARLRLDSATLTGVLDRLETAGHVKRRDDDADRRVQRLFLTGRGRTLNAPADEAMDRLNIEFAELAGGPTRAKSLLSSLRRLGGHDHV